ncbi:MAG: hypothetical protein ACPGC0_05395, partial [Opitutales bacterium]
YTEVLETYFALAGVNHKASQSGGGSVGIGGGAIATRSSFGCPISAALRQTLGGVSPTHPFQGCTIGQAVIAP